CAKGPDDLAEAAGRILTGDGDPHRLRRERLVLGEEGAQGGCGVAAVRRLGTTAGIQQERLLVGDERHQRRNVRSFPDPGDLLDEGAQRNADASVLGRRGQGGENEAEEKSAGEKQSPDHCSERLSAVSSSTTLANAAAGSADAVTARPTTT